MDARRGQGLTVAAAGSRLTRRALLAGTAASGASLALDRLEWLEAATALEGPAARGQWLAGDLHIHTGYSHDVWLPPDDDNTDPAEDFYTFGYDVASRFQQAAERGLDYLAITDHNDFRSASDPGFGSANVIGIPAYEASVKGHAQVIGATRQYDRGDQSAAAVNAIAAAVRADGGLIQANHPAYQMDQANTHTCRTTCEACAGLHWTYGQDVRPDTVEVWNPSAPPNSVAEDWWECWLEAGVPLGATGGSDSHWRSTNEVAGPGQPTTWVFAREASREAILVALREGRTSVSWQPPARGGPLLVLEADPARDGGWAAGIGDAVQPGTPMRVRVEGSAPAGAQVRVRANGSDLVDGEQLPGSGELRFDAPAEPGWVRASLLLPATTQPLAVSCEAQAGLGQDVVGPYCRDGLLVGALTSPVYLVAEDGAPSPGEPRDEQPVAAPPAAGVPDANRRAPAPAGPTGRAPALLRLRAARRVSLTRFLRRGIRVAVTGHGAGRARVAIVAKRGGREIVLASARPTLGGGEAFVRLRPTARGRKLARAGMRAAIVVEALDATGVSRRTLRGLTIGRR